MIVKQQIILTDEDKYLLSKPFPENPCYVKCNASDRSACCGCPEGSMYEEAIKPYMDAGIFDYAIKIEEIRRLKGEISNKEKMIENKYKELPPEIREFTEV